MINVWYTLAGIATIGGVGGVVTLARHRILDWWEGWTQNTSEPDTTDTTTNLCAFFDEPQPPADPWNGAESWSVDHGFNAEDQLDVIRAFARAGFDEVPTPAPLPVETAEPALLFDDLTAEYRKVNPQVAGNTTSWVWLSADDDQAIRDPYRTWCGFTPQLEPARVPAQRGGDKS